MARLKIDLSATSMLNKVQNEYHTLVPLNYPNRHKIKPNKTPFYADQFDLRHINTDGVESTLVLGTHYVFTDMDNAASIISEKKVYNAFILIDSNLAGSIKISSYQAFGDIDLPGVVGVTQSSRNVIHGSLVVYTLYDSVLNKPIAFKPTPHNPHLDKYIGFSDIIDPLNSSSVAPASNVNLDMPIVGSKSLINGEAYLHNRITILSDLDTNVVVDENDNIVSYTPGVSGTAMYQKKNTGHFTPLFMHRKNSNTNALITEIYNQIQAIGVKKIGTVTRIYDTLNAGNIPHNATYNVSDYPELAAMVGANKTFAYVAKANYPNLISLHAATTLLDGRVFICGGYTSSGSVVAEAHIYNPTTNTYTAVANMPTAKSGHAATTLLDGRVFICGGYTSSGSVVAEAHIYNPTTNTYTAVANMPSSNRWHKLCTLPDGRVFICGGWSNGDTTAARIYNPTTNTYTAVANMPTAVYGHTACTLADGRVFICGGRNNSAVVNTTAHIYNPVTNNYTVIASMPTGKYYFAATTLLDGRVFICGGYTSSGSVVAEAHIYNPTTNIYAITTNLPTGKFMHTANALPDGRVFICGGSSNGNTFLSEAHITDLVDTTTFTIPDLSKYANENVYVFAKIPK